MGQHNYETDKTKSVKTNLKTIYNIATNPCGIGGTETFSRILNKYYSNSKTYCFNTVSKKYYKAPYVLIKKKWFTKITPKFLRFLFSRVNFYDFPNISNSIIIFNAPVDLERISIPILKNNKLIYFAHNTPNHIWEHKNYFGRNRGERLKRLQYVDKIISLTPNYIPKFSKLFNISKERFLSVTHTVEITAVRDCKLFQKKIITICRIDNKQKRLDRFVEVAKNLPEYTFEIYGLGRDEGFLKELIKGIGNISYKGATNEIVNVHKDAGIFLMTSDFEGFGITLIEALSQATPVIIAPNSFDMANVIIEDGVNGYVCEKFDVNELIEKIHIIEKNYTLFSENTLKSFKRYDSTSFIRQWDKIFEEL